MKLQQIRDIQTKEELKVAVCWFVANGSELPFGTYNAIKRTIETKAEKLSVTIHELNRMIDT